MTAPTASSASRERRGGRGCFVMSSLVVAAFSCKGALGFVVPPSVAAFSAGGRSVNLQQLRLGIISPSARPRALPRLFSSKEPPSSGGPDFMEALAGGRKLSTEEKIAKMQKEIQSQAATMKAAEGEDDEEVVEEEVVLREDDMTPEEIKNYKFIPPEGFVDEGKNIIWPTSRRTIQLTVLAVIAQIAFVFYILSLNALLEATPELFGQFAEMIKSGNFRWPVLVGGM